MTKHIHQCIDQGKVNGSKSCGDRGHCLCVCGAQYGNTADWTIPQELPAPAIPREGARELLKRRDDARLYFQDHPDSYDAMAQWEVLDDQLRELLDKLPARSSLPGAPSDRLTAEAALLKIARYLNLPQSDEGNYEQIAEIVRTRFPQQGLTQEEARQLCELLDRTTWTPDTYTPEITVVYKKLRRIASGGEKR